ncbi:glycosyltransferase family 2 protein [Yoonia vestfoldensis]|uniref:Glycosyltransferase n=1 Tax=Yoonia vestfoldensis SKA53 TaxID=314232 RepID=A3V696_9RHOB|nr:glycosyltransferase family 2 protein [Yoonia vestfoldensis]EAQ06420.1 glycosyltransferase [Yoonia vestfoldensis SKA53]
MSRIDPGVKQVADASWAAGPTVDVVMPVYNGAAYLQEQVASILAQSDVTVRLIAVDDASTDESFALLNQLAAQDPRIKVLRNQTNVGLMRSLSLLLHEVTAQYFALSDQDDIWDNDKLSRSISVLRAQNAALVYSDVRLIDAAGNLLRERYLAPMGIRPLQGRDPVAFIFRNPAIGHTMVGTSKLARAVREIDPSLVAHEVWIIAAACKLGDVVFLDAPLGSYRQHGRNVTGARTHTMKRIARLFGRNGTLWRRQQTRIRAIRALAPTHPALAPIADAQARHGLQRLLGLPGFTAFMLGLAPRIGVFPALTEIALFPFAATPTLSSGAPRRVPSK